MTPTPLPEPGSWWKEAGLGRTRQPSFEEGKEVRALQQGWGYNLHRASSKWEPLTMTSPLTQVNHLVLKQPVWQLAPLNTSEGARRVVLQRWLERLTIPHVSLHWQAHQYWDDSCCVCMVTSWKRCSSHDWSHGPRHQKCISSVERGNSVLSHSFSVPKRTREHGSRQASSCFPVWKSSEFLLLWIGQIESLKDQVS